MFEDATILQQVLSLGHYPKSLNSRAAKKASEDRHKERALLARLERRTKTMDAQCLAFLEAVKKHGSVKRAQEAALTSAQAPTTVASSSRAAEPAIPPTGAASLSCESVHAVPAEPKRNAKRKLLDVVPASSAQQALLLPCLSLQVCPRRTPLSLSRFCLLGTTPDL